MLPGVGSATTLSGVGSERTVVMADQKNPGVAAVLSALIPGIGQFYNGDFLGESSG